MNLTKDDVRERFPEVEIIESDFIRNEVIEAFRDGHEEGFFEAPAATSYGYHNPLACSKHGLWIHTKMVFTAFERFHWTYTEMGSIKKKHVDHGRAACLLHDMRKHGEKYTGSGATSDHDVECAEWVAKNTDLPQNVSRAIASHMGPTTTRYKGPAPVSPLQKLVHTADMAGSTKLGTWHLYKPHDLIKARYDVVEVDL